MGQTDFIFDPPLLLKVYLTLFGDRFVQELPMLVIKRKSPPSTKLDNSATSSTEPDVCFDINSCPNVPYFYQFMSKTGEDVPHF